VNELSSIDLKKGDFVTDIDPDSYFENKQGKVSRVYKNGTIVVRYNVAIVPEHFFLFQEEPHDFFLAYKGEEVNSLRRDDEWNPRMVPIVTSDNVMQVLDELLDLPFWPQGVHSGELYQVQTDDSDGDPDYGWLMAQFSCDGDLHMKLTCDRGIPHDIRLRTYAGGGRHLGVRNAGLILAYAMKLDMEGKT